jgi:hypothetical protein
MTTELLNYEAAISRPRRRRVGPFAVAAEALGLRAVVPLANAWWLTYATGMGWKVRYAFSPICYGAAVAAVVLGAIGWPRERRWVCAIGITFGCVALLGMWAAQRLR